MAVPGINPIMLLNPQLAVEQAKIQRQQALAQQLLEQSQQQTPSNTLANPGGFVVPYTVGQGLASMAKALMGRKMLDDTDQQQATMYQSLAGSQSPSGAQGGQQSNLMGMIQGGTVTGSPSSDLSMYLSAPDKYFEMLGNRNMPTNEMKNAGQYNNNPVIAGLLNKQATEPNASINGRTNVPYNFITQSIPTIQNQNPMLANLIQAESGGNPNAVSPKGAQGIAQIMPATAADPGYGVQPLQGWDGKNPATAPIPEQARFANDYLNAQQQRYGDPRLAAAAYNAGPGKVDQVLARLPKETQAYVPKVAQMASNQPMQFGIDPIAQKQKEELTTGDTKYLNETLLPAKDAAVAANNNLESLKQAAAVANANDLTHTGPTAPARLAVVKHLNDFLASTGGDPIKPNEIANADAINKIGLRLTANMTKMLGSREAAQIFVKIQEANPNWMMQPQTLNLVTNLIQAENNTAIGKYQAGLDAVKQGGLVQDGVNAFEKQNPGAQHVKEAFAASGMAGFDNMDDPAFKALPPGTPFYVLDPKSPSFGQQRIKH